MHIIITSAGHSRRFKKAGYKDPKTLLGVGDRPMIQHVFDMFSPADHFHVVVNDLQVEEHPDMLDRLKSMAPKVSVTIIPPHELGPVYTALQVDEISDNEEVIISYNDFIVEWNYSAFVREVHGYDGSMVSFQGFHPASFGSTYYAYMKVEGSRLLEIREKQSFTTDRTQEHASAGIYYFRDWALFKKYAQDFLKKDKTELPEAYVSLLYNDMVADDLSIKVHDVSRFICLGTPEDYKQYHYWWDYFNCEQESSKSLPAEKGISKRVNLIPMAGKGRRYREYGYRVAKPLIKVRGKPMVVRSACSLPPADEWIFAVRTEELERHPVEREIRGLNRACKILPVEVGTAGQAATCLLARESIQDGVELMIASCDSEHRYSLAKWDELRNDLTIDGVVWVYRMKDFKLKNPDAYSYCKIKDDGFAIAEIVDKEPISSTPELDPLAVGTFWFRRAGDFFQSTQRVIEKGASVNGEYYVGASVNELINEGKRIVIFDLEQWISFGSPFELQTLEYWEDIFHSRILNFHR